MSSAALSITAPGKAISSPGFWTKTIFRSPISWWICGKRRNEPADNILRFIHSLLAPGAGLNRVERAARADKQGFAVGPAECKAGGALRGFQDAEVFAGRVVDIDIAAGDVDISVGVGHNGVAAAVREVFCGKLEVLVDAHQPCAAVILGR